jgi:hypothetical protein
MTIVLELNPNQNRQGEQVKVNDEHQQWDWLPIFMKLGMKSMWLEVNIPILLLPVSVYSKSIVFNLCHVAVYLIVTYILFI